MHWSEVWNGESLGPKLLRIVLTPPSWAYSLGWKGYLTLYSTGLKRPAHPHTPILCVGNLTVGGTGKTPVTIYLAKLLNGLGFGVTISCSGYGSPGSQQAVLAPSGDLQTLRWGDEAALLRTKLPDTSLIVGRNRVRAAEICHSQREGDVLLLDDGFQHLPLRKDISILLESPHRNRRCLPAGPYREPYTERRRADIVLPGQFEVVSTPLKLVGAGNSEETSPPEAANALCAIGSPERFLQDLRSLGIRLDRAVQRPDHDSLQEGNLFCGLSSEVPLIVTAKDWVKLRERSDLKGRRLLIAEHEIDIRPHAEFASWLQEKLNDVIKKSS